MAKTVIGGMEFDDKQAEAIIKGTAALAKAVEKVAKAFDGVARELGRMGKENSLFFAEMLRATRIAESFAEPDPAKCIVTQQQERDLRSHFPDRKIQAIKLFREITNLSLKDAKDLVDKYWTGGNSPGGASGLMDEIRGMKVSPKPPPF